MGGRERPVHRRDALGAGAVFLASALAAGCARGGGEEGVREGVVRGGAVREGDGAGGGAPASSLSPPAPSPYGAAAGPAGPRRFPGWPGEITHGPRDRPRIALTFEGRGDPGLARAALARIERAGARVTVLAVGSWLEAHPELARRILDGGHEIGNHTERHRDLAALAERDEHSAYEEIAACARRLRRLTGSIGTWFRPSPGPGATAPVRRLALRAGYPHVLGYDVESRDHAATGVPAVLRKVTGELRHGSVVGLSLARPVTVAALPLLLTEIDRRGLRAVTATELLS
ncbi:polysaccharide deacetylase family protein [Streptomyces sp. CFMR 7]|uniref:polysaccharide deacetylase family protein n=1 Tax=Streptomyces sp. CFMR 7 TaxID=1649184 RepID=UPI0011A1C78E|nr:polysaccharide deacetylase family protein [Streptomyces sp. CFMR 7]